jgi:hypothetical protein
MKKYVVSKTWTKVRIKTNFMTGSYGGMICYAIEKEPRCIMLFSEIPAVLKFAAKGFVGWTANPSILETYYEYDNEEEL